MWDVWLNKMSLVTCTTTIKKNKTKEGKKVTWEWLVAFATYQIKNKGIDIT